MSESFETVAEAVARIQRETPRTRSPDPAPAPRHARTAHAARQRRYRARQRNGEVAVTVILSEAEIDRLHRQRCLDLDKLENRAAIADAIHLLIQSIVDP